MSGCERVSRGLRGISALVVFVAAVAGAEGQTVLRVKQNTPAGDDGASWETAFDYLQDALTAAAPIAGGGQSVEIWLAAGTYRPDRNAANPNGTGDRTSSFYVTSRVVVYGGFSGGESQRAERIVAANPTILSGDLAGDDGPAFSNDGENSFHVVRTVGEIAVSAGLDGVVIQGGNADWAGNLEFDAGGAVVTDLAPLVIENCTVRSNRAQRVSGAIQAIQDIWARNCRFVRNRAPIGGAIGGQGLRLSVNCEFVGNISDGSFVSNPVVGNGGGAIATSGSNSCLITNCTFVGNDAWGAWPNNVNGQGAAIFVVDGSTQVTNSIFVNNTSPGGQLHARAGTVTVQHCAVRGGPGQVMGPGAISWGGGDFVAGGNIDADPMFVDPDGADDIPNNDDDDLRLRAFSPCVDRGDNTLIPGDVTLDLAGNPRHVNGYTPEPGATVDMGAFEYAGPAFGDVMYVRQSAPPGGAGETWATAVPELRDTLLVAALVAAGRGPVQVWVAAGTYRPFGPVANPDDPGRMRSFTLNTGVLLYGGFAGTESQVGERDPIAHATILSGDLNGDDNGALGVADNSLHVVSGDGVGADAVLDGFSVQAGNANGADSHGYGAGMTLVASSPTIRDCRFVSNRAAYGAGASVRGGAPSFERCVFSDNSATVSSGALINDGAVVELRNCDIVGNVSFGNRSPAGVVNTRAAVNFIGCRFLNNAARGAGGLGVVANSDDTTANFLNCLFAGNESTDLVGGIGVMTTWRNSTAALSNCSIVGNRGGEGGLYVSNWNYGQSLLVLTNCTVAANSGYTNTGGVLSEGSATIRNCLLWANTLDDVATESAQVAGANLSVEFTTVQHWAGAGAGNNSSDPAFADIDGPDNVIGTVDDDLSLTTGSAAIDSGDSLALPLDVYDIDQDGNTTENLPVDLAGQPRFVDDPLAPNTGPGFPPSYVDRGAFEFIADCPQCPGPRRWLRPQDGSFHLAANWTPSVPNNAHEVLFDHRGNTFAVDFDTAVTNARLAVLNGNVTFDLDAVTYRLTTTGQPSIVIGEQAASLARLFIRNGTLQGVSARVGSQLGSNGTLDVTGLPGQPATFALSRDLCVGCDGTGEMSIAGGGLVIARDATIGDQVGSSGYVTITGEGSRWSVPFFLIIDNGTLDVRDQGRLVTGFGTYLFSGGRIIGDGVIEGDVVNFGEMLPGNSPGTLTIVGNYEQVGQIPELGVSSGALRMEVLSDAPGQFDTLEVQGDTRLGGGLFLETPTGYIPPPGQALDLPLLRTARILPPEPPAGQPPSSQPSQFDVAYFPGIPTQPGQTGRFLSIEYAPTDGGVAVNLIVANLPGEIELNNPIGPFYDGQPTAVAIGKFDADNFDDLALTVSGPNPSLIVLRTAYNELGLYTPIPTLLGLPGQPTGVVISDLDHQSGKDVAVVMSDGASNPGQLKVFKSTGLGGGGELTFDAGITPQTLRRDPQGIAAADLDGDQSAELIISMAGENALDLFSLGNPSNMLYVPRTVCIGPRNNCTNQPSLPSDNRPVGVGLGDSNNDKNLDMAAANSGSGSITVYRNVRDVVGEIAFEEPARYVVGADPRQVLVADFNRDNDGAGGERPDDLAVLNRADGTVSILVRRPDITNEPASEWFAPPVALPIRRDVPGASDPTSIAAVDLDDDGDRELAGVAFREASSTERTVHVLRNDLNNGQLAFADAANQDAGEAPAFVAGGDLNGDGREDLVAVNGPGAGDGPSSGRVLIRLQGPPPALVGACCLASGACQPLTAAACAAAGGTYRGDGALCAEASCAPAIIRGDCNCDGGVNNFDIDVFVLALSDPSGYAAQYPNCDIRSADIDGDGNVNNFDIDPFVACIANGGCP